MKKFAYIGATGIGHRIASIQETVHLFVDFLILRAVIALVLIEESGLALTQCRDLLLRKVLTLRVSSGLPAFLIRRSSLHFLRRSFSSLLDSGNE